MRIFGLLSLIGVFAGNITDNCAGDQATEMRAVGNVIPQCKTTKDQPRRNSNDRGRFRKYAVARIGSVAESQEAQQAAKRAGKT
jgi:hypothetical protein